MSGFKIDDRRVHPRRTLGRDADIAIVLTPNTLHTEYVRRALAVGLAVVVEKPVAVTVDDLDQTDEQRKT